MALTIEYSTPMREPHPKRARKKPILINVSKKFKFARKVSFDMNSSYYTDVKASWLIEIAKYHNHTRWLCLLHPKISQRHIWACTKGMKHMKKLKRVDYAADGDPNSFETLPLFHKTVRAFYLQINKIRPDYVNILHKSREEGVCKALYGFEKFLSKIKNVGFYSPLYIEKREKVSSIKKVFWETNLNYFGLIIKLRLWWNSRDLAVELSPSKLKKFITVWNQSNNKSQNQLPELEFVPTELMVTSINLESPRAGHFILPIIFSVPALLELFRIDITCPQEYENQSVSLPITLIQNSAILQRLRLQFEVWPSGFEELGKLIVIKRLKELDFTIKVTQESHIKSLLNLIEALDGLQVFNVKVVKYSQAIEETCFLLLVNKISLLKTLKAVKMHFEIWPLYSEVLCDMSPMIDNFFDKPRTLESFYCHYDNISPLFGKPFLKKLLERGANLKKLYIDIGRFIFEETDFTEIIGCLKQFKLMEEMELYSLDISNELAFLELIDGIYMLEHLRTLAIGNIHRDVGKACLLKGVKKILVKKGLRKFQCSLSSKFQEYLIAIMNIGSMINTGDIFEENPDLETYPASLPIFLKLVRV